jgi:hypothetical protein
MAMTISGGQGRCDMQCRQWFFMHASAKGYCLSEHLLAISVVSARNS